MISNQLKHVGSFILLFLLSVLSPSAVWPEIPFSFAPLAVLVVHLLLIWKIYATIGFVEFWHKNKKTLVLFLIYQTLCALSLLVNKSHYDNFGLWVQWGWTFVIVQSALIASVYLFLLPQNTRGPSLSRLPNNWVFPFIILIFAGLLAVLQNVNFEAARGIHQFFIAGNTSNELVIRSIFATHTDLGAISATLFVCSLLFAGVCFVTRQYKASGIAAMLAAMMLVAGLLSGARIFVLMLGVAAIVAIFSYFKNSRKQLAAGFLLLLAIILLLLHIVSFSTAVRLAHFFPFVAPLNTGIPFEYSDLTINLMSEEGFSGRINIWSTAVQQIFNNPLLGTSNGVFRFLIGDTETGYFTMHNAHNLVLQSALDAGIFGLLILLLLVRQFWGACKGSGLLVVVFCTVVTSLLVDNFTDHSLPWIFVATFTLCSYFNLIAKIKIAEAQSDTVSSRLPESTTGYALLVSVMVIALTVAYQTYKRQQYVDSSAQEQFVAQMKVRGPLLSQHAPYLVTSELVQEMSFLFNASPYSYLSPIEAPICDYNYPDGITFSLDKSGNSRGARNNSPQQPKLKIINFDDFDTSLCTLSISEPFDFSHWKSNNQAHFLRMNQKQGGIKSISLNHEKNIAVWSPIFDASEIEKLQFRVSGSSRDTHFPVLMAEIFNAQSGARLTQKRIHSTTEWQNTIIELPFDEHIYVKLHIDKDSANLMTTIPYGVVVQSVSETR